MCGWVGVCGVGVVHVWVGRGMRCGCGACVGGVSADYPCVGAGLCLISVCGHLLLATGKYSSDFHWILGPPGQCKEALPCFVRV